MKTGQVPPTLKARLQAQMNTKTAESEDLMTKQFQDFEANLSNALKHAQTTIESAINETTTTALTSLKRSTASKAPPKWIIASLMVSAMICLVVITMMLSTMLMRAQMTKLGLQFHNTTTGQVIEINPEILSLQNCTRFGRDFACLIPQATKGK